MTAALTGRQLTARAARSSRESFMHVRRSAHVPGPEKVAVSSPVDRGIPTGQTEASEGCRRDGPSSMTDFLGPEE